jgi:hypothetical protein
MEIVKSISIFLVGLAVLTFMVKLAQSGLRLEDKEIEDRKSEGE